MEEITIIVKEYEYFNPRRVFQGDNEIKDVKSIKLEFDAEKGIPMITLKLYAPKIKMEEQK
jgi:hypothetical protein